MGSTSRPLSAKRNLATSHAMLVRPLLGHHRWRAHAYSSAAALTFTWTFLILGVKQHSDIPTGSSSCLCLLAIMGRMTMGCVIQTGLHLNRGECYRSTRNTDTLDKQGQDLILIMDRRAQNFQRRRSLVRTRGLFPVFQIYLTHGPSTITLCMSKRTTGGLFLKRQATCTSPKWSRPMWATTPAS